jgi:hypothetical protein
VAQREDVTELQVEDLRRGERHGVEAHGDVDGHAGQPRGDGTRGLLRVGALAVGEQRVAADVLEDRLEGGEGDAEAGGRLLGADAHVVRRDDDHVGGRCDLRELRVRLELHDARRRLHQRLEGVVELLEHPLHELAHEHGLDVGEGARGLTALAGAAEQAVDRGHGDVQRELQDARAGERVDVQQREERQLGEERTYSS